MVSETSFPQPRCDVATLRAFVAIARQGSVLAASKTLQRTQPSLTARLQTLERDWNTRLFLRSGRGMTLTPEGAALLPLAEAALRSMIAVDEAAGVSPTATESLRFGAGDSLGRELVPRALQRLLRKHPSLPVHVVEGPRAKLRERLLQGHLDLALAVGNSHTSIEQDLEVESLLQSEVVLLVPPKQKVPRQPLRLLQSLRTIALHPQSAFRRHLETVKPDLASSGVIEVGNLSLVARFVAAGLGAALVPGIAFPTASSAPRTQRIPIPGIAPVPYQAWYRKHVPRNPMAESFVRQLLRETAE